jgi:hypothetical protein
MSKLMEALKASGAAAVKGDASPAAQAKSEYEMIQEKLGEVYFSGGDKAKAPVTQPIIIKVVEKPGASNLIPWIIASVAFLITALSLFSTKRVFVDIKVIDEKHPYFQTAAEWPQPPAVETAEEAVAASDEGAERVALKNAVFEGAGRLKSSAERSGLTLVNSSVAPFARASIRPAVPLNLAGSKIVFYARGMNGGEKLAFALKDKGNVLGFDKGKVFPFPDGLTTDWQRVEIPVDDTVVGGFNKRSVVSMRFEFGSNVRNRPGDTIFVKDLQILN